MRFSMPNPWLTAWMIILFLDFIAWATDKPSKGTASPLPPRAIHLVPIDRLTSDRLRVVTGSGTEEAVMNFIGYATVDNPKDLPTVSLPPVITRAVTMSKTLHDTFHGRVTVTELDLTVAGQVHYGLAIKGNISKDLANLRKIREFLEKNEAVTAIESGSFYRRQDGHIDNNTLTTLVESFPSVRMLHLANCPITADSLATLSKWTALETLKLQRVNLSGKSITPLGKLTELQTLELVETNTNNSLEFLKNLRKLDRLFCRTDDENTKWIGTLNQLRTLDLCGSGITDSGLKQLAGLTNLKWLGLQNSNITDAGLPYVSKMIHLHYLNISGTSLNGEGLAALKDLPLSQLEMQNSRLTGENWMRHVPDFKSYDTGLMMITRSSKITPDEANRIRKMLKPGSQAFLHDR